MIKTNIESTKDTFGVTYHSAVEIRDLCNWKDLELGRMVVQDIMRWRWWIEGISLVV